MSAQQTDLQPVTFVRDIAPGPIFEEGTQNKLYRAEDGTLLASSWCPAHPEAGYDQGETVVWEANEEGEPTDERIYMFGMGHAATIDGDEPAHEEALAKFGYRVVSA